MYFKNGIPKTIEEVLKIKGGSFEKVYDRTEPYYNKPFDFKDWFDRCADKGIKVTIKFEKEII